MPEMGYLPRPAVSPGPHGRGDGLRQRLGLPPVGLFLGVFALLHQGGAESAASGMLGNSN